MIRFYLIIFCIASQISVARAQQTVGVVINELMSANSDAVADPAGDFDDWIELYNNENTAFDLSGFGLSDDIEDLGKYRFPEGTVIEGNGYLIVWADDDQEQGPLHAQFKLAADGEAVYLTDVNNVIIDDVIFGEVPTNAAFAREPNGTGDFVVKGHTIAGNNNTVSSTKEPLPSSVQIFPNPSQDYINLDLDILQNVLSVQLLDIHGRIMIDHLEPSSNLQLDISRLSSGSYFLKIDDYEAIVIQKID